MTVVTRTVSASRPAVSPALAPVRSATRGSTDWGDAAVGGLLLGLLAGPPVSALARRRRGALRTA